MPNLSDAIERLIRGLPLILVDDQHQENEGDLVLAAQFITSEQINFMMKYGRGRIHLAMDSAMVNRLGLPPMVSENRSPNETAFATSIGACEGVDPGISAFDRARTIRVAVSEKLIPNRTVSPGHVYPLRVAHGGVLARAGHPEGAVDLMRIAGLKPAAVICEIMGADGNKAKISELQSFADMHDIPITLIRDIRTYRLLNESLVKEIASANLPSAYVKTDLEVRAFQTLIDGREHLAVLKGEPRNGALVRVHSECLTGDALGSLRCDCGEQLRAALARIGMSNCGALLYMTGHEGRGVGLANKIRAYALQDKGADTVAANTELGFGEDERDYGVAAQILKALGIRKVRLLSNNPRKRIGLETYGIEILEQVPLIIPPNPYNERYLTAKREKLGHELSCPLQAVR